MGIYCSNFVVSKIIALASSFLLLFDLFLFFDLKDYTYKYSKEKILLTSLLTLLIEKCVLYLSLMPPGSELRLLPDER